MLEPHPFWCLLGVKNKISRRASPTFSYGSFYCLRKIELGNHLAKRRVQGRKRLFLAALCSAQTGVAARRLLPSRCRSGDSYFFFGCCYSRRGLPANQNIAISTLWPECHLRQGINNIFNPCKRTANSHVWRHKKSSYWGCDSRRLSVLQQFLFWPLRCDAVRQ